MSRSMKYSAYEPPVNLWALIEEHVPDSEQPELKNLLGESLVDQSVELQQEVDTLLEIWRDVQRTVTESSPRHLPEPPGVRERLVQQILFYVDSVKEKLEKDGRDPNYVLSKCKTDVIEYACDSARGSTPSLSSRASTARSSRDGRETPWRHTPSSDRALSITSIELESMNRKLNVLEFDEVSKHLSDYLQQEVQQLLEDIPFLQECIEKTTNDSESEDEMDEPTLHDLREERTKLERELLSESPRSAMHSMPEVLPKMTPYKAVPSPPRSAAAESRRPRGPVKASHGINVRVVELPDHVNPTPSSEGVAQDHDLIMTSQPSTNQRPSSADRFRRMVLNCRDT